MTQQEFNFPDFDPDVIETPERDGHIIWTDTPAPFRHVVDKARLSKMIRNSDTCRIWCAAIEADIIPQKTDLLVHVKGLSDLARVAVEFNGIDLTILSIVHEDWAADYDLHRERALASAAADKVKP